MTAACAGATEPLWDAQIYGESEWQREVRHVQAKAICAGCPIRDECLATALIRREEGVWGGRLMNTTRNGPPSTNPNPMPGRPQPSVLARTTPQRCDQCGETVQRRHMGRHQQRRHEVAS